MVTERTIVRLTAVVGMLAILVPLAGCDGDEAASADSADGSDLRRLTDNTSWDWHPDWR